MLLILVYINERNTTLVFISRKHHQDFPPIFMNGHELDISTSFTQLCLAVSSNLIWKPHVHSIVKHASQKLGFLSRACGFFSASQLLTIYKSRIRPSLVHCPMFGVVVLNLHSIFLAKSNLNSSVLSLIQYLTISLHLFHRHLVCRSSRFLSIFLHRYCLVCRTSHFLSIFLYYWKNDESSIIYDLLKSRDSCIHIGCTICS